VPQHQRFKSSSHKWGTLRTRWWPFWTNYRNTGVLRWRRRFYALSTSTSKHETVHVCRTAYTLRPFPPLYHAPIFSHFNFSGTCCSKCGGERMLWRKDRVNSLEGKKGTNTETIAVHVHTLSRRHELVLYTSEVRLVRGALKLVTISGNSLSCTDVSIRSTCTTTCFRKLHHTYQRLVVDSTVLSDAKLVLYPLFTDANKGSVLYNHRGCK